MRKRFGRRAGVALIAGICYVVSFWISVEFLTHAAVEKINPVKIRASNSAAVTMLAFGDINLGRAVGQKILHGDVDYPFRNIRWLTDSVDIVFANLECQLSDQHGETQDPKHNLIFTGPPEGALSLAHFGITVVSTANNHAFDYGVKALFETIDNLDSEHIAHSGTGKTDSLLYEPLLFVKKGIRFALFAVTDVMNFSKGWQRYVAEADTANLFPAVRRVKSSVDVVIVSYHGGDEYAVRPSLRTRQFAAACLQQGVQLFLGHHPHVPYGVTKIEDGKGTRYIVYSLGNFVFSQPQYYWTQHSIAVRIQFEKSDSMVYLHSFECIPLNASMQPSVATDSTTIAGIVHRVQSLSNTTISFVKDQIH
ncbi:MAG: CapA family protein [Bacteroidota bacterium]|nr:CapA family protein [Bacteroidota bacterium]